MGFLYQLFFSIKRLLKNVPALITKLGVFILLTFILGSVFTDSFEKSDINDIDVVYVVDDQDAIARSMIEQITSNEEVKEYITFSGGNDFSEAEKKLAEEEYNALLYIPDGFVNDMREDGNAKFEVYMTSYAETDASVIKSVLNAFLTNMNAELVLMDIEAIHYLMMHPKSVKTLMWTEKVLMLWHITLWQCF